MKVRAEPNTSMVVLIILITAGLIWTIKAGDLNPPRPPTSGTMKTLDQAEPRIPIAGSETPVGTFTISKPGSYYLTGDRHCLGYGIYISADNVTLDLNGYSLIGSGTSETDPSAFGIFIYPRTNVEIKNGTVINFKLDGICQFHGVDGGAKGIRIINVRAVRNGSEGIRLDGKGNLIDGCTVQGNGERGIVMLSTGSKVSNNVVSLNNQYGIRVNNTNANCLLIHNVIYDNDQSGGGYSNLNASASCSLIDNHAP